MDSAKSPVSLLFPDCRRMSLSATGQWMCGSSLKSRQLPDEQILLCRDRIRSWRPDEQVLLCRNRIWRSYRAESGVEFAMLMQWWYCTCLAAARDGVPL